MSKEKESSLVDSLADFAAKRWNRPCKVCRLPKEILDQVNAGLRAGIGSVTILNWLKQQIIKLEDRPQNHNTILRHKKECLHEAA